MIYKWASILLAVLLAACGNSTSTNTSMSTPPSAIEQGQVALMGDSLSAYWAGQNDNIPVSPNLYQLIPGIIDAGVPGNTSEAMWARFSQDVLQYAPRTVLIWAGTNDIQTYAEPSTEYVQEMADEAKAQGAKVVILTIPPSPALNQTAIAQWNAQLLALGLPVADISEALLNATPPLSQYFYKDGIHLNNAGYAVAWSAIEAQL
jgi:lysophospholipase L1-like esterase